MRNRYSPVIFLLVLLLGCLCGCADKSEETTAVTADPGEGKVMSSDGIPVVFDTFGEGAIGIVLVHCWSCDRTFWSNQVDYLAAAGYRVVTLDLPGHGETLGSREEWTFSGYGADVKAVADKVGLKRMVIVGHSMGARVALEAAGLMPGRVAGVVSVDALINADWKWPEDEFLEFITNMKNDFPAVCDGFVRGMIPQETDVALHDDISSRICDADPEIAIALMKHYGEYDEGAALGAAGVPVRALISPAYPANIEGNRKYNPDYEAYVLEGTGHFPHMEKPEEFNARLSEVLQELLSAP